MGQQERVWRGMAHFLYPFVADRIKIISEDIAGNMGRKIVYNTERNEAIVYKVNKLRSGDWYPYVNEGR